MASKSNSEVNDAAAGSTDSPYVHVKLTKEVLHAFEESTKTSATSLIVEYLQRCEREPGEIEGLMTTGSSEESRRSSSESDETSEEDDYDQEDDDEQRDD